MKFNHVFFRIFQKSIYLTSFVMNFKEPTVYAGQQSTMEVKNILKENAITKVMVVTDKNLISQIFFQQLIEDLKLAGIDNVIYQDVRPNPPIKQIERAYAVYKEESCQGMIAVGGGSAIDTAKGIGILVSKPKVKLQKMRGIIKVRKKQPLLIAIPTTAGTGSEATVACVVTDDETKEKYAINDPCIIPKYAILDPFCTVNLPDFMTSTTGMDALTHAVEAYIGHSNTKKTKKMALEAILTIKEYLLFNYEHLDDLDSRAKMLEASYQAGVAFTRAYVGNVHALAHQLGGMYHTPHGFANAVILPVVLKTYGNKVVKKLAEIARYIKLDNPNLSDSILADSFIDWIDDLNRKMKIPASFDIESTLEEITEMSVRAYKEANPLYPVPVIFDLDDFSKVYQKLLKVKR